MPRNDAESADSLAVPLRLSRVRLEAGVPEGSSFNRVPGTPDAGPCSWADIPMQMLVRLR